jgi:hypothetical protein
MKAILSIFFFVVFGLIGMRISGALGKIIVAQKAFDSPDQHGQVMLIVNLGIVLAMALIGVAAGLMLAPSLQRKFIREERE